MNILWFFMEIFECEKYPKRFGVSWFGPGIHKGSRTDGTGIPGSNWKGLKLKNISGMPKTCACWVGFGCCFNVDDGNCYDNGKHWLEDRIFQFQYNRPEAGTVFQRQFQLETVYRKRSGTVFWHQNCRYVFFVEIDFTKQKWKLAINSRLSTETEKSFKQFQNWCDHPLSRIPPSRNGTAAQLELPRNWTAVE